MKNVVMMLVSGVLGLITLAIVMTICGKMNRSVEVQSSLSSVMEMTVEQMVSEEGKQQYDEKKAVAECIENMTAAMDTDSDMTVKVYQADVEKGVLAINIFEQFRHPNGMSGSAEWGRTVIYNKAEKTEAECYEVRFYKNKAEMLCEGNCYKSYVVQEGEHISAPVDPLAEGAAFAGWKDVNDYIADFSQPVEQDRAYYAEWE